MLYIYLDESYNLHDRSKKQFISINGVAVLDTKPLFKKWKNYRKPFIGKRRIHAVDSSFIKLKSLTLRLITQSDLKLLTIFQVVQQIPFNRNKGYFYKNKLHFEQVYLDMLKILLTKLNLGEFQNVQIIIHSRKYKGRVLSKNEFKKQVDNFLKQKYSKTKIIFKSQAMSTDVLLELADFISNIFYQAYITNNQKFFEQIQSTKLLQIKNPL